MISFTFPLRLVSEANRASSQHWRVRAKRAKQQKHVTHWAAWAAAPEYRDRFGRDPNAPALIVTMVRIAPCALDSDNVVGACKYVRDALAQLLGIDDGDPRIDWRVEQRKGAPKQYAVEIRIETRIQDHNVSRGCAEGVENS